MVDLYQSGVDLTNILLMIRKTKKAHSDHGVPDDSIYRAGRCKTTLRTGSDEQHIELRIAFPTNNNSAEP